MRKDEAPGEGPDERVQQGLDVGIDGQKGGEQAEKWAFGSIFLNKDEKSI
jgi:hypothetical protein